MGTVGNRSTPSPAIVHPHCFSGNPISYIVRTFIVFRPTEVIVWQTRPKLPSGWVSFVDEILPLICQGSATEYNYNPPVSGFRDSNTIDLHFEFFYPSVMTRPELDEIRRSPINTFNQPSMKTSLYFVVKILTGDWFLRRLPGEKVITTIMPLLFRMIHKFFQCDLFWDVEDQWDSIVKIVPLQLSIFLYCYLFF